MPSAVALEGQVFGRLMALSRLPERLATGKTLWLCRCECGATTTAQTAHLRDGRRVSCGCAKRGKSNPWKRRHGHFVGNRPSPTYSTWQSMISRCKFPYINGYHNYGGRGIRVCDRWLTFANFLADMGERPPGMSIDRVNADGHYEPGNCRWATATEQMATRRGPTPQGADGRFTGPK